MRKKKQSIVARRFRLMENMLAEKTGLDQIVRETAAVHVEWEVIESNP
jgi:hypothetical protein